MLNLRSLVVNFKLVSTGSLAFALRDLRLDRPLQTAPPTQGRITWSGVPLL